MIAKQKEDARIAKQKEDARIAKQKEDARIYKEKQEAIISKEKQDARIYKQTEELKISKQQEEVIVVKQPDDQKSVEKLESKPLNNQINIDLDSGIESIKLDDEYTNNSKGMQIKIKMQTTDNSENNCIEDKYNSQNHINLQGYGVQNYLGLYGCSLDGINIENGNEFKAKIGFTKQYPKKREWGGNYPREKFMMISIDSVKINCECILKIELEKIPGVKFSTDEKFTFPKDKYAIVKKTYNKVVAVQYV